MERETKIFLFLVLVVFLVSLGGHNDLKGKPIHGIKRTSNVSAFFTPIVTWIHSNGILCLCIVGGIYCLMKWRPQGRYEEPKREFIPLTPEEIEREKRHEERRRKIVEEKQKEFSEKSEDYHQARKDWKIKKLDQKLKDIEFLSKYEENPSDAKIHRPPPNVIQLVTPGPSTLELDTEIESNNDGGGSNFDEQTVYGKNETVKCLAKLFGITWEVLIDTGASCSIISPQILKFTTGVATKDISPHVKIYGANNLPVEVTGVVPVSITIGDFTVTHECFIAKYHTENLILGCDFHRKHKLQLDFYSSTLMFRNSIPVEFSTPEGPSQEEILMMADRKVR